jgi:hypothetical protein
MWFVLEKMVKVKVKVTSQQAKKAGRVSRGIALLFKLGSIRE